MRASSTMGPQLFKSTLYSSILGLSPGFSGSHLILDLDEGVQHHGAAVVQVHLVLLHPGLVSRLFGVPSVDGKGLLFLRPQAPCSLLLGCCCLRCSPDCCIEGGAGGEAKKLGCCVDCHGSSCTTDSLL